MIPVQETSVGVERDLVNGPRYSFYIIPFKYEPFALSAERLARLGYDALEIPGNPSQYLTDETRTILRGSGLAVSAVCSQAYGLERDLTTAQASNRSRAFDYFCSLIDMAAELAAPAVILGPMTSVRRNMPESPPEQEYEWAVETLRRLSARAVGTGVQLVIEPWNRYETHLVNRIEQGLQLIRDAGGNNLGVMGDLFHMNIEEADIAAALRLAGSALLNIHFADSNRRAPGRGHIDFSPIAQALREIDYQHYLSVEYLPPRFIFEFGVPEEFVETYPAETIAMMRRAYSNSKHVERSK